MEGNYVLLYQRECSSTDVLFSLGGGLPIVGSISVTINHKECKDVDGGFMVGEDLIGKVNYEGGVITWFVGYNNPIVLKYRTEVLTGMRNRVYQIVLDCSGGIKFVELVVRMMEQNEEIDLEALRRTIGELGFGVLSYYDGRGKEKEFVFIPGK